MKKKTFLCLFLLVFTIEIIALVWFMNRNTEQMQDSVEVNEAVQSVLSDWETLDKHRNHTELDYTILNNNETILYQTRQNQSNTINEAILHRDTILDLQLNGENVGKIIIINNSENTYPKDRKRTLIILITGLLFQLICSMLYMLYLNHTIIRPFHKLEIFAQSVAGGNLDLPLTMDRQNIFGAFTESFDIMRSELKKAKLAEAKANADKKELVAKLSHDIRTPVASIKAASEVGAATAENEKTKENYESIIQKTDQINTLVTNLFSSTLEELQQLTVELSDMKSKEIKTLLENADYLHYAAIPAIPECLVIADRLRLQQVFDNIFANSYKYAGTKIKVSAAIKNHQLTLCIEDNGGGVSDGELLFLKEKFRRGNNSKNIDGAGLGLYICDCLLKEMKGELMIENGMHGLAVTVFLALS